MDCGDFRGVVRGVVLSGFHEARDASDVYHGA